MLNRRHLSVLTEVTFDLTHEHRSQICLPHIIGACNNSDRVQSYHLQERIPVVFLCVESLSKEFNILLVCLNKVPGHHHEKTCLLQE